MIACDYTKHCIAGADNIILSSSSGLDSTHLCERYLHVQPADMDPFYFFIHHVLAAVHIFYEVVYGHWALFTLTALPFYMLIVKYLRYQRVNIMHRKFHYSTQGYTSSMTMDDAYAILMYLIELEFPTVFSTATAFAIFKASKPLSYGPGICTRSSN